MDKMPEVAVQKYADRIPVALNADKDVAGQIDALVTAHGAGSVFVDGKSVAQSKAEAAQAEADAAAERPVTVEPVLTLNDSEIQKFTPDFSGTEHSSDSSSGSPSGDAASAASEGDVR